MEDFLVGLVGEADVVEADVAADVGEGGLAGGFGVFLGLGEDLGGAVEAGEGFGELGADGDELSDGGDHEREEHHVGDVAAGGEGSGDDLAGSEPHDEGSDDAEDGGGGEGHHGLGGERRDDVLEEALGSGCEDVGLGVFGVVALHDADAAEGLGEAAGDLGVDLGALAEDGANGLEGALEDETEDDQDDEG